VMQRQQRQRDEYETVYDDDYQPSSMQQTPYESMFLTT